jgi:CBS domain containing-hemolysin-like protein
MPDWVSNVVAIGVALFLVILNGFFVAAEFALVKVRGSQIDELIEAGRPFAKTARWLADRLEPSLSACQLGITMASLALGWVGEPAFAGLLEPMFTYFGVESEVVLHTISFIIAFTAITALHLVIGEQAPKIFAIRRPDVMLLWCALPMKFFFIMSYPLMAMLNWTTAVLLGWLGLDESDTHGAAVSEAELRLMIRESHQVGELTLSEHKLLNAVFEFDDMLCRRVMVPRGDVDYIDVNIPFTESIKMVRLTRHTRYPVCNGSLDDVLGVVHIKDLVGLAITDDYDVREILRPLHKVPEYMPVSKLLRHFQTTHQLLALVLDEHGTAIGIVTLENVLEEIIGDVDDEFDNSQKEITPQADGSWLILGNTAVEDVCQFLNIPDVAERDSDTFAGLLMEKAARVLVKGDTVPIGDYVAEVVSMHDNRAERICVRSNRDQSDAAVADSKPAEDE